MDFWGLLGVASMPILKVLIVSAIGAFMATDYLNLLPSNTRISLNKIVFMVFTPSLLFANLVQTVTLQDIISMWFMPINIGLTFLCGGILGWIVIKLIKPKPHLEGLVMAMCATGNFADLLLIMVPAMDNGSPFGDHSICKAKGISYASFSMAFGSFYTWTCTYQMMQASALKHNAIKVIDKLSHDVNNDLDANQNTHLLNKEDVDDIDRIMPSSSFTSQDTESQGIVPQSSDGNVMKKDRSISDQIVDILKKIVEQLLAPPTLGAIRLFLGAIPWVKNLLIGEKSPLRVVQDSMTLLGDATIPCLTLILGGNLTQGLRKASVGPTIIMTVMIVRYLILPMIGIGVIKLAANMGLVPLDPLFRFVLLLMFSLPPGVNISTMAVMFNVGQQECAMLMMWTYLAAAFALTAWSSVYMWILS